MYTIMNAVILTVDQDNHYYPHGAMVVDQGKILAVGDEREIEVLGEVIDMKGKLVMPGLINTHTHSHSSIFRNLGDDMKLMDWLHHAMWPMEKALTAQTACDATALSCLEYIRNGITTYADQFYFADDIARTAMKSGLRCFLAASVFEHPCAETDDSLGKAMEFVKSWKGKEEETCIYPCFGPHAPYSVSGEQFQKIVDAAQRYQVLIHTHISETTDENQQIYSRYGMSPTAWLDSLGVFSARVLAAHSIHLSDADLDIYARNHVAVTYNPVSNLKLVSGVMPIEKMLDRGITVSIGTDGAQSNNSMDLLQDIKIGVLIQKQKTGDATYLGAESGVRMLTIEGAKALGMETVTGSLEVGKAADFISLDPSGSNLVPLHKDRLSNLYAAVVYSACGGDVADTVVNGNWLMRDRSIQTLSESEVLRRGQEASEYLVRESKRYLES